MSERKAISKRLRFEVFKRDAFVCQYCGAHPPAVILHCDHIQPVADGGPTEMDNLITACEACNLGKGAVPLSVAPESLAAKAERIAEAEEQLAGYSAVIQARRERIEADVWRVVEELTGESEIRRDRYASIKRFVERLGAEECIEAAEIARNRIPYARQRFTYFCGICWRKIRREDGEE
jgi:hypothetical protein